MGVGAGLRVKVGVEAGVRIGVGVKVTVVIGFAEERRRRGAGGEQEQG